MQTTKSTRPWKTTSRVISLRTAIRASVSGARDAGRAIGNATVWVMLCELVILRHSEGPLVVRATRVRDERSFGVPQDDIAAPSASLVVHAKRRVLQQRRFRGSYFLSYR